MTKTVDGQRKERTIRLDWQGDPERLDALYWECQTGRHERQQTPSAYTWKALVVAWRTDPRVQSKLADGTKRSYRREMDALLIKNAGKDVRKTTRQGLRKVHAALADTPRKADWRIQIVSLLWNYGKLKADWPLGDNPATGIDLYGVQNPFEPWPEWMVEKLIDAPENVRTTAELIMGSGQRPSAAIEMKWEDFKADRMTVLDEKQDERFDVHCPDGLRAYLDTLPKRGAHVLAKNLREPLGYDAVERPFRKWRTGLGPKAKPYSLHGLRKLAIIRLAEAGWSDAEIQAATNQSPETVAYYRRKANRLTLTRSAHERRT
ncbi:tyrosine-type recombinase/integrase [Roseivivax isoporae]|nr:tyrosine-type recombinase/integrase [Roseivivax isoporae]